MNLSTVRISKQLVKASLPLVISGLMITGTVQAGSLHDAAVKILQADFPARSVVQIEAGDFHFKPGQVAPVHTHSAPAVGYVVKGEIIYQVEGEKPQLLREGDAFYEPAGPRILRFDNASASEKAVFVDFNLEQEGEPFIVFEEPLTEEIDRRTLPTIQLNGQQVKRVDIFERVLKPNEAVTVNDSYPVLAIVAEGIVVVKEKGKATRRVPAGSTFAITASKSDSQVMNISSETVAKVITFRAL